MGKKVEEIHGQLVAFYPEYTDQGNVTRVIYVSDFQGKYTSTIDLRQVESVKRSLAVLFFLFLLFRPRTQHFLPSLRHLAFVSL
ncbi:MAG: hypothetical protein PHI24_08115 [Desulfitobacteriaceae bacterium]|nr:hypothetical protein [Desulfitobacteriaceae bacterium]